MIKMKSDSKTARLLLLFASMLFLLALLALPASAEEGGIWLITSADGSTRYSDDAVPFATPEDGATYTLLADSVNWNEVLTVTSDASYTIDLSGKTVHSSAGFGNTPLTFSGTQHCTVLADGTLFDIAADMSIFWNLSGYTVFSIDGGEGGFTAYCPSFVNADGNAVASVSNGHMYKNSGHVKALLCARTNTSVTVNYCSVCGDEACPPLYVNGKGTLTLSSCTVIAGGETAVFCDTDNGVLLTVKDNTVISGAITGIAKVNAEPGTRFTDIRTSMLQGDSVIREIPSTLSFRYTKTVDGAVTEVTADVTFPYLISGKGKISSERSEDSVWMILDSERNPSYCDDLYTPFASVMPDSVFVLLQDLEIPFFPQLTNSRAMGFDFSGQTVKQVCDIPAMEIPAFFSFIGEGSVSLNLSRSVLSLKTLLLSDPYTEQVDVISSDAFVFAPAFFSCQNALLTVTGGYYDGGSSSSYGILAGVLSAEHVRIVYDSENKQACHVKSDATLADTHVIAQNYGGALLVGNVLTVDGESPIYGSVSAYRLLVGTGNLFAGKVKITDSVSVLLTEQETPYSLLTFSYDGENVVPSLSLIAFTQVTTSPIGGMKASLYFGPEVLLHLYVPSSTVHFSTDFSVRMSVNGILYEASTLNGIVKEIDGEEYYMFTYRYLYHNQAQETAHCALVLGGVSSPFEISLRSLLLNSAERAEGDARAVIANYLAYTLYVSGAEDREELLAPYADLIREEKAELVEDESISEIIRAAAFDPKKCTLEFAFAQDFSDTLTVSYRYDGKKKTLTVDASASDTFTVLIYRMDPTDCFTFSYEKDGEEKSAEVSILTFAALSDGTVSADDLDRYISYLSSLN